MTDEEREELLRRAKAVLSRSDVQEDRTVIGRKYLLIDGVYVVKLGSDVPSAYADRNRLLIYVGTQRVVDVSPYGTHWDNPSLEEIALATLRRAMVLDELAATQ